MWGFSSSIGQILLILLSVAFFSLFERKVMAGAQARLGPNKVSIGGVLQPLADALKLTSKVEDTPSNSESVIYTLSPCAMLCVSILAWSTVPIEYIFFQSESSMVIIALYFSVSVYGLILSGWSSNSRYATLGCVRAITQSISFEIGLSIILVFLMIFVSSTSVDQIISYQSVVPFFSLLLPLSLGGTICLLAESGRSPFDLAEGESELVSGYSVEYGGSKYTIIFLSENLALLLACKFLSIWFFGGWLMPLLVFVFVLTRSTLPRVRYDKMMCIFWCSILPIIISLGGVNLT